MSERTDTEMLDWLDRTKADATYHSGNKRPWAIWDIDESVPMLGDGDTLREAIFAAMDAAEQGLEDRAWKWLQKDSFGRISYSHAEDDDSGPYWDCRTGPHGNPEHHFGATRSAAVIAAYKASGGT